MERHSCTRIRFCLIVLNILLLLQVSHAQNYRATVVAFKQEDNPLDFPIVRVSKNVNRHVAAILDLKDNADIIVFPEYGITTKRIFKVTKEHLDPYVIKLPKLPAEQFENEILVNLSRAAKSSKMYVVTNVLEEEPPSKIYSTNIVFNSDGNLIAKCRNKHLFLNERTFDEGDSNQDCTFEANFNGQKVQFALLFDGDTFMEIPNTNIKNAVITSSLQNTFPFPIGVNFHLAYAVKNRINVLASGYTYPFEGYGGTGIYLSNGKSMATINATLLVEAEIPVNTPENVSSFTDVSITLPDKLDVLQNMSYQSLDTLNFTKREINHSLDDQSYCSMTMMVNGKDTIEPYKWVALKGSQDILGQHKDVLICALIKPKESLNQKSVVDSINIVATTTTNSIIQALPFSLGVNSAGYISLNFKFNNEKNAVGQTSVNIKSNQQEDLSVFGVLIILKNGSASYGASVHFSQILLLYLLSAVIVLTLNYSV